MQIVIKNNFKKIYICTYICTYIYTHKLEKRKIHVKYWKC